MDKKFTKGGWYYDETSKGIKNSNVKGLLATAWSTYNAEIHENILENESWLSMRERTKSIRYNCEIERIANAKLIAAAPEMLEILEYSKIVINEMSQTMNSRNLLKRIEQLIKKATL